MKTELDGRHILIKRDLKLNMGDIEYDIKGVYTNRVNVSQDREGRKVIEVDFSTRPPGT